MSRFNLEPEPTENGPRLRHAAFDWWNILYINILFCNFNFRYFDIIWTGQSAEASARKPFQVVKMFIFYVNLQHIVHTYFGSGSAALYTWHVFWFCWQWCGYAAGSTMEAQVCSWSTMKHVQHFLQLVNKCKHLPPFYLGNRWRMLKNNFFNL